MSTIAQSPQQTMQATAESRPPSPTHRDAVSLVAAPCDNNSVAEKRTAAALLIDGGYFRRSRAMESLSTEYLQHVFEHIEDFFHMELKEMVFVDAEMGSGPRLVRSLATAMRKAHVHCRIGKTKTMEKHCKKCGAMNRYVVQAGVDVTFATEAIRCALDSKIDALVLWCGDGDFIKAIELCHDSLKKEIALIANDKRSLSQYLVPFTSKNHLWYYDPEHLDVRQSFLVKQSGYNLRSRQNSLDSSRATSPVAHRRLNTATQVSTASTTIQHLAKRRKRKQQRGAGERSGDGIEIITIPCDDHEVDPSQLRAADAELPSARRHGREKGLAVASGKRRAAHVSSSTGRGAKSKRKKPKVNPRANKSKGTARNQTQRRRNTTRKGKGSSATQQQHQKKRSKQTINATRSNHGKESAHATAMTTLGEKTRETTVGSHHVSATTQHAQGKVSTPQADANSPTTALYGWAGLV